MDNRRTVDAVPKHKHRFVAHTLEKNIREGSKFQTVVCTFPGCGLTFRRDKEFKR